jgi:predicted dienelactone hydrolase
MIAFPKHLLLRWLKLLIAFSFSFMAIVIARPSYSAESIQISYGLFERSIPIQSLETYATTGEIDEELAAYTRRLSTEERDRLRQILQTRLPLNTLQVSQFLYTPIGVNLLTRLSSVLRTNSETAGFYGLRAALILAANDPQGLTLLNLLRQYPLPEVRINLARSLDIVETLQTQIEQTNRAIALINQSTMNQSTTNPPTTLPTLDLQQPGTYRWQKQTLQLTNQNRNRSFPTDLYLPQTETTQPIVVISHGLGSDRTSFAYLAQHLASYGFVVAVPEHPGSNAAQLEALQSGRADQVTPPREFVDRPLDIRDLLDELSRLSQSDSQFQGRFDVQQVGVIGQSFGGYTALALAGAPIEQAELAQSCQSDDLENTLNLSLLLQCLALQLPPSQYELADPRIKAAIAINPVSSSIFGQTGLSQIRIPTLIVASSNDAVAPALPEQIRPFSWLTTPDKYLLLLNNGTHFSTVADSPNQTVPIPDEGLGDRSALARDYMNAFSTAFFQTYLAKQPDYRSYLTSTYASEIERSPLTLSLVQSLPTDQFIQGAAQRD